MTKTEVMAELKKLGTEQTRKTLQRHGAPDNSYGVKIGDLKVLQKKIKKDYKLALELFDTGNSDAMYLAGLIADVAAMTKKDLQTWAENATSYLIREYTVAWVAAGSPHGWEMANKWIDSKNANLCTVGWSVLSSLVGITANDKLDLPAIDKLLDRVAKTIHAQPDRVRYCMNGFVIAVGGYVLPLHEKAIAAAKTIGPVTCEMGDTACKVPDAVPYIEKMKARGTLLKKRKDAKC